MDALKDKTIQEMVASLNNQLPNGYELKCDFFDKSNGYLNIEGEITEEKTGKLIAKSGNDFFCLFYNLAEDIAQHLTQTTGKAWVAHQSEWNYYDADGNEWDEDLENAGECGSCHTMQIMLYTEE